jgi:stage III sporulation protein SpoIIIAA
MEETHHRTCVCGAVYNRTASMAPERQISSFECSVCDQTMESWNTAWVPSYRLIAGPVRAPQIT